MRSHHTPAARLAALDDASLGALLDTADALGTGIGGTSGVVHVDGTPVFVKRVPLTARELAPGNVRRTANLFGLPSFYQYGVGSAGFGAWRELATHEAANSWVLGGEHAGFPLMHHWRVLPRERTSTPEDVDRQVAYWEGSPAVRERLEALATAPADLVLLLQYVPQTLHGWLTDRAADGEAAFAAAVEFADAALLDGVAFLRTRGYLHFDAHPLNVLTDGTRLYFADFGLALHDGFELTADEADFFRRHVDYDRYDVARYLVNWLVRTWCPAADLVAAVRDCAIGRLPAGLPAAAARIIERDAPIAAAMNDFYGSLVHDTKTTPFPPPSHPRVLSG